MAPDIIINVIMILLVAWFFGSIFQRLKMPRLLGELLSGLLLGPTILGLIRPTETITILGDLGIFFLMFYSGMEMDPEELLEHFWVALAVAIGGFLLPFAAGYGVSRLFGATVFQSLFIATGLSVTALAVQARLLKDMEIQKSKVGHIIIAAAIVDDVLVLIIFSLLTGLAKTGQVDPISIIVLIAKIVSFFVGSLAVGYFLLPRITRRLRDEEARGFTFALLVAFIMGYLAEKVGLHLIIGAFLAGQFVRKDIMDPTLYEKLNDRFFSIIYGFLGPIFFVSLSFNVSLDLQQREWGLLVVLIAVAALGKIFGCGIPALMLRRGWRESLIIGLGMNGRGAVELILAKAVLVLSYISLKEGIINEPLLTNSQFTILILIAFFTTILAPISLRAAMPSLCSKTDADFCELWRS